MANSSSIPDPSKGLIYGPTGQAAGGFPSGVYVALDDWQAWQAATLAMNQASADAALELAQKFIASPGASDASGAAFYALQQQQAAASAAAAAAAATKKPVTSSPAAPSPIADAGTITTPIGRLQPHSESFGVGGEGSYCDYYPDDPLCEIWWTGGPVYGGGEGGGGVVEPVTIIQEGLSAFDVAATVDRGLSGLWSNVVGAVDVVLGAIVGELQSAITTLGNAVKAAFAVLARLGGFILNALRSVLHGILRGVISVLQQIRDLLNDVLGNVIVPMLQKLQEWRKRLIDIYTRLIRPVLIILQDVRKVLRILVLFHVPFAAKLDSTLASLEAKLTKPLLLLLGYVNQLANWMNLILRAGYLFQRPIWLQSLKQYAGASINLQINAMNPGSSAADIAALQAAGKIPTAAETSAAFDQFVTSNSGPTAAVINDSRYSFDAAVAAVTGNTPLAS